MDASTKRDLTIRYKNQIKYHSCFEDFKPREVGVQGHWYGHKTDADGIGYTTSISTGREIKLRLNYCTLPDNFYAKVEDAADADLRVIPEWVMERYFRRYRGYKQAYFGTDSHWRVYNRHKQLIGKCIMDYNISAASRWWIFQHDKSFKRWVEKKKRLGYA